MLNSFEATTLISRALALVVDFSSATANTILGVRSGNIPSISSMNSEAKASEFIEDIEGMFLSWSIQRLIFLEVGSNPISVSGLPLTLAYRWCWYLIILVLFIIIFVCTKYHHTIMQWCLGLFIGLPSIISPGADIFFKHFNQCVKLRRHRIYTTVK